MYLPEAIKKQTSGPGRVLNAGLALISVVTAGIALGFIGIGGVVLAVLILIGIEVWREAANLTKDNEDLTNNLAASRLEASAVPGLRLENKDLHDLVAQLRAEMGRPRLQTEEMLDVIRGHLELIEVAEKHRRMDVVDIPVTRAELLNEDSVLIIGTCAGNVQIEDREWLSLVERKTGEVWGGSEETHAMKSKVEVRYSMDDLPSELVETVVERGSAVPRGFVLRLAGLCLPNYGALKDDDLRAVKDALGKASDVLALTLAEESLIPPGETMADGEEKASAVKEE